MGVKGKKRGGGGGLVGFVVHNEARSVHAEPMCGVLCARCGRVFLFNLSIVYGPLLTTSPPIFFTISCFASD